MEKHLAVIFSDWHIHNYKMFNEDNSRLGVCLRVLKDIGMFCRENGIVTVFFVGDLYDTQKALLTEVVNDTVDAFLEFEEEFPEITIFAISGNHDHSTKNTIEKPAVSALHHIEAIVSNFVIIDNDADAVANGIVVFGVPYYEYKEQFEQKLTEISERAKDFSQNKKYLLIHQTPPVPENTMIPWDVNPKDERFDVFDFVFCGHIHIQRQYTEKFALVGNPIHRDAADAGKKKGFLVMNLAKPQNGYKFIPLEGYPEFIEAFDDEEVPDAENNYVIRKARLDTVRLQEAAKVDDFNTDLTAVQLMTNFFNETTDGKDEELLSIGLGFLQNIQQEEQAEEVIN